MRNFRQKNRELFKAVWSQNFIDVEKDFCVSAFHYEDEVSEVPLKKATEVRPVDDGSPQRVVCQCLLLHNGEVVRTSVDQIIVSRTLRTAATGPLAGWRVQEASVSLRLLSLHTTGGLLLWTL